MNHASEILDQRNVAGNGSATRIAKRFTLDGSPQLEQRLATLCDQVLTEIRKVIPESKLQALVLGGGYGRGQGGVLQTDNGDAPYNDLEFYVFLRGHRLWNERRFRDALHVIEEKLSPAAGLHVEFKIESLARLRRSPVTMFSYDLISGHRVICGAENIFENCAHLRRAEAIPISEATRLLFNRCTGLLLAKERLLAGELAAAQRDFIGRNLAKAQLAFGDVVLTAAQQYHWSCLERHARLRKLAAQKNPGLPLLENLVRHHAAGLEFKLHPRHEMKPRAELLATHHELSALAGQLWLWLENRRLHRDFTSVHDYALSAQQKCFDSPGWRNALLTARTFGLRALFELPAVRYPRERLLNSLPLLLWDESLNDLRVRRHLQKQLRTPAADWQSFVAAYKMCWPRFS